MADAMTAALMMSDRRAAEVLTWADEPELMPPGRPPTAAEIEAARLRERWNVAEAAAQEAEAVALCASLGIRWPR